MADVYKIGVSIVLVNGVSPVLGIISRDLFGLTSRIGEVESAFNRLGGLKIAATLGIGVAAEGMMALVNRTKDLSHELVQLQKLGVSPAQQDEAYAAARELPFSVPGITQKDVLAAYNAIYSPLGHEGALKVLKPLEQFAVVIGNTMHDFEGAQSQIIKALRSGELMGAFTDPATHAVNLERVTRYLDVAEKVIAATHGVVNLNTLLGMAQQGGPAMMNLSEEGLATEMMLAQMMGGPRAGTAIMSMFQQNAGVMFKRTAEEWERLGLLKPGEWVAAGGHVSLQPEASKRLMEQFGKDPLAAMKNVIVPAMEGSWHQRAGRADA